MPAKPVDQFLTFLYTRDLPASVRFYEGVLGLRLARDQGDCRIYHVCGSSYLGICARPSAPDQPGGIIVTLVTDEVDAWVAKLMKAGAPIEKEPALNERYGIYHCFVRDPNGYLLEFQRFVEPLE